MPSNESRAIPAVNVEELVTGVVAADAGTARNNQLLEFAPVAFSLG